MVLKQYILIALLLILVMAAKAQSISEMTLYKGMIPGSRISSVKERTIIVEGTRRIYSVTEPTLTKYKPARPNGISVIICPGGSYIRLSIDNEGVKIAKELNKLGVTAFVLKYRLPNDSLMIDPSTGSLQDIQQAIRIVRNNATSWGIKKDKIGIMGFSAGGHLASTAATHFNFKSDALNKDTVSVRPDFVILIYPVISFDATIMHKQSRDNLVGRQPALEKIAFFSNELHVTKNTPPVFIVHAGDDASVPVENSTRFYLACIKNKVPAEMHLYPHGGHGFGLKNNTTKDKWFDRLATWLGSL